jgi:hypothetical protein
MFQSIHTLFYTNRGVAATVVPALSGQSRMVSGLLVFCRVLLNNQREILICFRFLAILQAK